VSGWVALAGCAALAVTAIAAFFVARALAKAKQRKAVEDARQRMDAVSDHVPQYTRDRLRNSRF
jgi:uncharacterized membrane protein